MTMRVFVTGATGVLGRRVVPRLIAAKHDVTAVARTGEKATAVEAAGAHAARVDLFDADQIAAAMDGHDAALHLATNIPTGASAIRRSAWRTNDRLRTEAAANVARAALDTGVGRYVGESITFPYVDSADRWIDEHTERTHFFGTESTVDAEAAAQLVTDSGGVGVVLRFAVFWADDSAHMDTFFAMARRGLSPILGRPDAYVSFIDIDDAAAAVLAALDVAPGTYNVAEPDPRTRAAHMVELARAVGRNRLRSVPQWLEAVGGKPVEVLARSQRVSSRALIDSGGWRPETKIAFDRLLPR